MEAYNCQLNLVFNNEAMRTCLNHLFVVNEICLTAQCITVEQRNSLRKYPNTIYEEKNQLLVPFYGTQ